VKRTKAYGSPRRTWLCWGILLVLLGLGPAWLAAQANEECLMCHEDKELTGTRDGREISVFVDAALFAQSIHGDMSCVDCHTDVAGIEGYHDEELQRVDCATCHDDAASDIARSVHGRRGAAIRCADCHGYHDVQSPAVESARANPRNSPAMCGACHGAQSRQHARSLHGRAARAGDELAPDCVSCHQSHLILNQKNPESPIAIMNIPLLCGQCHHEGTEVSLKHDIPQDRILENYSQSIHGEGLFKKGLTVTAVCTSCHTSHEILEHTDPRSSIHRNNVATMCTACHARIETVHLKVIEGRLWEHEPHKIPSCVECHSPHKIRRVVYQPTGAANEDCLHCHTDPDLYMERDGLRVSLFVNKDAFYLGKHKGVACAQCHTQVNPSLDRACAPITQQVDCSICHADQVREYQNSIHGRLQAKGDPDGPVCLDCHEKHATQDHLLPTSRTYARNIPELCARCHRQGEVAARRIDSDIPDIVNSYEMSIHGKGLVDSGLVVSASCTDCHTTHNMLPTDSLASSVNPANIAATCGRCHHGIEETFKLSIHWPENTDTPKRLPTCESCHTSHTISRTDKEGFRFRMMEQCGQCHETEATTFFDTYHGKVSRLGSEGAAKCYDCHGTHNILPSSDPNSMLSMRHVVDTCAQCHPGAHRQFAGYLSHATHHDPDKYPFLFYSFWFMTFLLVGTLTFAILHTLAWLWRLWRTREQWIPYKKARAPRRYYRRFSRTQRYMHLTMMLSFFTLALTGMALKFSYMGWAVVISDLLGGFDSMGTLHRIAAVVLIGLFLFHLAQVVSMKRESGKGWLKFLFGPDSMMFTLTDIKQVWGHIKWFFGKGERPPYGRWTYWEKFDYFAVFWGVIVIGSTGLMLWFPELFTYILPGWSINVATIIHSDEALLAVGFIFTVHFFNTHFRPDKFPMDPVIFTGRVPLEELKHDKPGEYEAFVDGKTAAEIEAAMVEPFPEKATKFFRIFGFTALFIGLSLIFFIVYTMLFGYR